MNDRAFAVKLLEQARSHASENMCGPWDAGYIVGLIDAAIEALELGDVGVPAEHDSGE